MFKICYPILRDKLQKKEKTQTLGRNRNPKESRNAPGDQIQKETHNAPLNPIPPNGQVVEEINPQNLGSNKNP